MCYSFQPDCLNLTFPACVSSCVHTPQNGGKLALGYDSPLQSSSPSRHPLLILPMLHLATWRPCWLSGSSGPLGMPGGARTMLLWSYSRQLWTELVWDELRRNCTWTKPILAIYSCPTNFICSTINFGDNLYIAIIIIRVSARRRPTTDDRVSRSVRDRQQVING